MHMTYWTHITHVTCVLDLIHDSTAHHEVVLLRTGRVRAEDHLVHLVVCARVDVVMVAWAWGWALVAHSPLPSGRVTSGSHCTVSEGHSRACVMTTS